MKNIILVLILIVVLTLFLMPDKPSKFDRPMLYCDYPVNIMDSLQAYADNFYGDSSYVLIRKSVHVGGNCSIYFTHDVNTDLFFKDLKLKSWYDRDWTAHHPIFCGKD